MAAWLDKQLSSRWDLDSGLPFSSGELRNSESCNPSSLAWLGDDLPEFRVLPRGWDLQDTVMTKEKEQHGCQGLEQFWSLELKHWLWEVKRQGRCWPHF